MNMQIKSDFQCTHYRHACAGPGPQKLGWNTLGIRCRKIIPKKAIKNTTFPLRHDHFRLFFLVQSVCVCERVFVPPQEVLPPLSACPLSTGSVVLTLAATVLGMKLLLGVWTVERTKTVDSQHQAPAPSGSICPGRWELPRGFPPSHSNECVTVMLVHTDVFRHRFGKV